MKKTNKKGIDNKRREKLANIGKSAAALAAMAVIPSLSYGANLSFGPKNSTEAKTLTLTNDRRVGIRKTPEKSTLGTDLVLDVNGEIAGTRVWNAVWNDLAEFRPLKPGVPSIAGKCYVMTEAGIELSSKKGQIGTVGICSDTFGYALGSENANNKAPIGISGWVLAYVDKKYPVGTALVSGPNGKLTKASLCDKILNSERIVGIVETSPAEYNNLKIDGRYWIKIV